jgi:hypothetical protein
VDERVDERAQGGVGARLRQQLRPHAQTVHERPACHLRRRPVLASAPRLEELTKLLMLVGRHPLMQRSYLEGGVEYEWFHQFVDPPPAGADESFRGLTSTVQVGNVSDYQGYFITTLLGFEARRLWLPHEEPETSTRAFITMYAGVQD